MNAYREEWLRQANYDMETAEAMFSSGRYIYAVFMTHLAVEKTLKGLYHDCLGEVPPKTHNLVVLATRIGMDIPPDMAAVMVLLNQAQIGSRYPNTLQEAQDKYTRERTHELLDKAKELKRWLETR
jgi:HEPN domain-containing protein